MAVVWFRLAPSYVDFQASRAARDRVLGEEGPVSGIDGAALLREGLIREVQLRRGARTAYVYESVLLACGRFDLLAQLLAARGADAPGDPDRDLHAWCVRKDPDAARRSVEAATTSGARYKAALIFLATPGDRGAALRLLEEDEQADRRVGKLCFHAKIHQLLLGDEDAARRRLREIEPLLSDTSDTLALAEAHLSAFGDSDAVRRWIQAAESRAREFGDWRQCAVAWRETLDDADGARRGLDRAAALAADPLAWTRLGESWKNLWDDTAEMERALTQAESLADGALDWTFCASSRRDYANDPDAARRHQETAERRTLNAGVAGAERGGMCVGKRDP